jgi:hypothetical protein
MEMEIEELAFSLSDCDDIYEYVFLVLVIVVVLHMLLN